MASSSSGSVSTVQGGASVIFTDTGTYSLPVISRTLLVVNANGQIIGTFNMGNSTSWTVPIPRDGYYSFTISVTDQTGAVTPATVTYNAIGVYTDLFLNLLASRGCNCDCGNTENMIKAELCIEGANSAALYGQGVNADNLIIAANEYLNAA